MQIQSRRGNVVIGVLGVVYAVSAIVLLVVHFRQTMGAASTTDRAVQLLLVGVIAVSIWFIAIAARGLGMPLRHLLRSRRAGAAGRP